jgi:CheY-like chemotaxis protein
MTNKIILLVEDNPDDIELTLEVFESINLGNKVVVARNGVEALDYLFGTGVYAGAPAPVLPQVMLLDIKLPKIDGLEVLRRVRGGERTRRLPVVILTSSKEESDLAHSYDLGVNSYIHKPVDFEQFTQAVRQLGLYWLLLNELPPEPGTEHA